MFIVSPNGGLCNQLQTIAKTLCLGIKYNRNIYIDKFRIDYRYNKYCDINNILNIDKINIFLQRFGNIKIIKFIKNINQKKINEYKIPNLNYNNIPELSYINNYIEENLDKNIIYLGNIVSLDIYKTFGYIWDDNSNNYHLIMSNLIFIDKFYEIKNDIKTQLGLNNNFTSIHLRIEDDMIFYGSKFYNLQLQEYNTKLLSFYDNSINSIDSKIYICSGILNFDNKINYNYYNNLKNIKLHICDKNNINIDSYYKNNRELIAIIDLLISQESSKFIGSGVSSFSTALHQYFKLNNKDSELFHL
jgi:hypothetical protein